MKKLICFGLSLLMLVMSACSAQPTPSSDPAGPSAAPVKNELIMAMSVDPDGLDPQRTTAASTFQITNNLYEPLLKVTTDGTLKAGLAESWTVSEDGMTLTFTLRGNAQFSNGNPCDSAAVIASFERLKAEGSPRAADYANLMTMEAPDAKTVVFTTETLDVAILSTFAYPWAAIVDVTVADTLKNQPVGTGAYTLKEWVPQQSLTLVKNENYPETVNLETIQFKMMPDAASQISAFQNGELDIISVSGDQVAAFENNPAYTVVQAPANSLLKEAGYENGLTLNLVLPKNYTAYVNAGQVIADQLEAVGIHCEISIVEWASWLSDVYNGRQYDLTVVGHTGRLDPYVLLARYQSASSENYFNYNNPEVDQLLSDYKAEGREAQRTEIVKRVEEILAEEVPALYIQDPISIYVLQKGIEGFATYPIDIYEMKDVRFAK